MIPTPDLTAAYRQLRLTHTREHAITTLSTLTKRPAATLYRYLAASATAKRHALEQQLALELYCNWSLHHPDSSLNTYLLQLKKIPHPLYPN